MADYLPKFSTGQAVTFTAASDVIGGRLVSLNGDRLVGPAAAGSDAVVGVAGFDAAAGERVTVFTRGGGIHPLLTSSPITAGATVSADSAGRVKTAAAGDPPLGLALTGAAAGALVEVVFA